MRGQGKREDKIGKLVRPGVFFNAEGGEIKARKVCGGKDKSQKFLGERELRENSLKKLVVMIGGFFEIPLSGRRLCARRRVIAGSAPLAFSAAGLIVGGTVRQRRIGGHNQTVSSFGRFRPCGPFPSILSKKPVNLGFKLGLPFLKLGLPVFHIRSQGLYILFQFFNFIVCFCDMIA